MDSSHFGLFLPKCQNCGRLQSIFWQFPAMKPLQCLLKSDSFHFWNEKNRNWLLKKTMTGDDGNCTLAAFF